MPGTNNTMPLYLQVKERIRSSIAAREYRNGEKLPTEMELCQQYQVSRITVRKAVEELCQEGFLVKKQGKGTFVKQKKIHRKMEHLLSFSQACASNGMEPSADVLKKEAVRLEAWVAEEFGLKPGMDMVKIRRLRKADGVPIMLENNYYPYDAFQSLLQEDLEGSLYRLLEEKYQVIVESARDTYLDVVKADTEQSGLLEIGHGEPLYCMKMKVYDKAGREKIRGRKGG